MLAAGCSSSSAQPVGPPAEHARLGLIEWDITTSSEVLADGDVELVVTNAGATVHDLRLVGERTDEHVDVLEPGESASVRLNLEGEQQLQLWCTVPGHRSQGMERSLTVGSRRPVSHGRMYYYRS
jgi:hypothetical protein